MKDHNHIKPVTDITSVWKNISFTNKHLLAPIPLQSVRYYELWSILDKFSFNYECGKDFDWEQLKNTFFEKDDI